MSQSQDNVFAQALAGDRRALARAISLVEGRAAGVASRVATLPCRRRERPGLPHVIGVTGPPGAGKSTLVNRLIRAGRERGARVGVVAVDPSSPFSGGAILGDRLRMEAHASDQGVFIRSLASRGHLGGLSRAAGQVVDLLDACGYDLVLVETVGVGQSELSVMEVADTVAVVLTPESGDVVQTMKAGLLEVADVFVVNKADRPGADLLRRELELMVHLDGLDREPGPRWEVPVLCASAAEGRGIDEVVAAVAAHGAWCQGEGRAVWRERRASGHVRTFLDLVAEDARDRARTALRGSALERALREGAEDPALAAARWTDEGARRSLLAGEEGG